METEHREPVTARRQTGENVAILVPLGIVVAWLATLLPVEVPDHIQTAIAGLVVALGARGFSWRRDVRHRKNGAAVVSIVFLAFLVGGCASYDGVGYGQTAAFELARLDVQGHDQPLDPQACFANDRAADALADEDGSSSAFLGPFGVGQALDRGIQAHTRLAAICRELVKAEIHGGVESGTRTKARSAMRRAWVNGLALFGKEGL